MNATTCTQRMATTAAWLATATAAISREPSVTAGDVVEALWGYP